jgi:hypothetical protein
MSPIGQPRRATQACVLALFREEPHHHALGSWIDRPPPTKAKSAAARHQPRTSMNNRNRDHSSLRQPASVAVPTPAQGGARH